MSLRNVAAAVVAFVAVFGLALFVLRLLPESSTTSLPQGPLSAPVTVPEAPSTLSKVTLTGELAGIPAPGESPASVLSRRLGKLKERYFEIIEKAEETERALSQEDYAEISAILEALALEWPPEQALENLRGLATETSLETIPGSLAVVLTGAHLSSVLAAGTPELTTKCHDAFIDDEEDPAVRKVMISALLAKSGLPSDQENAVLELEYDMLDVVMTCEDPALQCMVLQNLPRCKNTEVIELALDWALSTPEDTERVRLAVDYMATIRENHEQVLPAEEGSLEVSIEEQHAQKLYELGLSRGLPERTLYTVAKGLGKLKRHDLLGDLRKNIVAADFSQETLRTFDDALRLGVFK